MALTKAEKLLAEAIDSMLKQDAKLGLAIHDQDFDSAERGYEYLHNQIDEMFELKASDLTFSNSVNQAFRKVHSYKYIDDPSFKTAMEKELVAQAVPATERKKATDYLESIVEELKNERQIWNEKDSGFHPDLADIMEINSQELTFNIEEVDGWPTKANVTWDKGNASPARTD